MRQAYAQWECGVDDVKCIASGGEGLDVSYLSMTPPESPLLPRLGAMESSSSKNMTQGVADLARAKTTREGERDRIGMRSSRKMEVSKEAWLISTVTISHILLALPNILVDDFRSFDTTIRIL